MYRPSDVWAGTIEAFWAGCEMRYNPWPKIAY